MAKPNQYNQQFEKHHIATLRKWATVRGITQARWRSKALQLMVEEAAIEQVPIIGELTYALDRVRLIAKEKQYHGVANLPVNELLLVAVLHWAKYMKDVPVLSTVMDEDSGS